MSNLALPRLRRTTSMKSSNSKQQENMNGAQKKFLAKEIRT